MGDEEGTVTVPLLAKQSKHSKYTEDGFVAHHILKRTQHYSGRISGNSSLSGKKITQNRNTDKTNILNTISVNNPRVLGQFIF